MKANLRGVAEETNRRRNLMILLLAMAGAGVDAVAIMGFNVLTGAQTGNTVLLAAALARGQFLLGLSTAVSVAGFIAGAAFGEVFLLRRPEGQAAGLSPIARVLLVEAGLLVAFAVAWHWLGRSPTQPAIWALVSLLAAAMGVQSVAVRHLHNGPTTTYITGVLTNFTEGAVRQLFVGEQPGRSPDNSPQDPPWKYGLVWSTYLAGAVFCGVVYTLVGELALLLPVGAVGVVVAMGPRRW